LVLPVDILELAMADLDPQTPPALSRRRFLQGAAAATAGAALPGCLSTEYTKILECAKATACAGTDLSSVKHIVMFMQENRSFDHYFGMLPGVRGFGDPTGLFKQPVPPVAVSAAPMSKAQRLPQSGVAGKGAAR